jgi:hypothetical protein
LQINVSVIIAALQISLNLNSAFAQSLPNVISIENVTVVSMEDDRLTPVERVIVTGHRISAIVSSGDTGTPTGALVIDGSNRFLLPGLVDSHVHLTTDMPWAPARPDFGDAPLYLAHGVTTVFNLGGTPTQLEWKRRIESGELTGPAIYTAGEFVNEPRVKTADDVARDVSRQSRAGYDLIKFHEIMDPVQGFTTIGLSRDAYLQMFKTARDVGLPVFGHAPVNLGLDALLASGGGAVAHVGEFNRLYFLADGRGLLVGAGTFVLLALTVAGWSLSGLLAKLRGSPVARSQAQTRAQSLTSVSLVAFTAVFIVVSFVTPGGVFFESIGWRVVATVLIGVFALTAFALLGMAVKLRRDGSVSFGARAVITIAALAVMLSATIASLSWLPTIWRSTPDGVARLADRLRDAGISVQSTLVVYDVLADAGAARRVLSDPAFAYMSTPLRQTWQTFARQAAAESTFVRLLAPRLAQFNQSVLHIFNQHGVRILAGTDAMGVPFTIPGSSLHRELQLMTAAGFTPYEALRSATKTAADFIGNDKEFGTISVGKRADLLLLDHNPLESVKNLKDPAGVMVRGKWLSREALQSLLSQLATR